MKSSIDNIRRIPRLAARLDDGRLKIVAGDGRRGYSAVAPYDAIHVGAAAPELPPAVRKHTLSLICCKMLYFLSLVLSIFHSEKSGHELRTMYIFMNE